MIDRQKGKLLFECDTCSEVFEPGTGNFEDGWNKAKAEGWKATKVGELWTHSCGQCEADA